MKRLKKHKMGIEDYFLKKKSKKITLNKKIVSL